MEIGIIGAGQIGGTLTRRLIALGHNVFVANSPTTKRCGDQPPAGGPGESDGPGAAGPDI